MSLVGVRRDKATLSSGCKPHPAPLQPEATGAVSTPRRENTRTSRVGLGAERVVGLAQVGVDASHRRLDSVFFGIEPGTKVCDGVLFGVARRIVYVRYRRRRMLNVTIPMPTRARVDGSGTDAYILLTGDRGFESISLQAQSHVRTGTSTTLP